MRGAFHIEKCKILRFYTVLAVLSYSLIYEIGQCIFYLGKEIRRDEIKISAE